MNLLSFLYNSFMKDLIRTIVLFELAHIIMFRSESLVPMFCFLWFLACHGAVFCFERVDLILVTDLLRLSIRASIMIVVCFAMLNMKSATCSCFQRWAWLHLFKAFFPSFLFDFMMDGV